MCSLVVRFDPADPWPLRLAANRDEHPGRPWDPPDRHWPARPAMVAGRDRLAGGSWLGVNDHGVVAAVLDRTGSLGPVAGKRSRGELVPEALDHVEATAAVRALAHLDPWTFRPFNLLVADPTRAFWLRSDGRELRVRPLGPGVHMLTGRELDDPACPRIRRHLPLFRTAAPPEPEAPACSDWRLLLAAHVAAGDDPRHGMCLHGEDFGTLSASLLLVDRDGRALWHFAAGPPCRTAFRPVAALARTAVAG